MFLSPNSLFSNRWIPHFRLAAPEKAFWSDCCLLIPALSALIKSLVYFKITGFGGIISRSIIKGFWIWRNLPLGGFVEQLIKYKIDLSASWLSVLFATFYLSTFHEKWIESVLQLALSQLEFNRTRAASSGSKYWCHIRVSLPSLRVTFIRIREIKFVEQLE